MLAAENETHLLSHSFRASGIPVRLSWALHSLMSHKAAVKVLAGTGISSQVLAGEESTSKFTDVVVDRIPVLEGHWSESLSSLLVVEWRLSLVSCHILLSQRRSLPQSL